MIGQIEVSRPFFPPQGDIVVNPDFNTTSADSLFLYPQGARIMTKEETKWLEKLDTLDKASLGISAGILVVGAIDLFAHLPSMLPLFVDLLFIGGGFSLFITSILLAKRIGLK